MASPVAFPEANLVLRPPTAADRAAGTVVDLPVHRYRDLDGKHHVLSKWKFTPEELEEINRTGGVVWFDCWGDTHPPVCISGSNPFVRSQQETVDEN